MTRADGFTLIEVMIAASILMVGLLGTFAMLDGAQSTTRANATRTMTLNLAREISEQARSIEYVDLTPSQLVTELRKKPNLAGTIEANGLWTLTRRGVQVGVVATVCTFDDPADGLAAVPPQNACPAATAVAGAPPEVNPDDFRRVSLLLKWTQRGRVYESTQVAQISNPSGGRGPRITAFPDPFSLQVTTAASIPFVVTSTTSTTVRWSMDDGVSMGDAVGGPNNWTFNWNIGTVGTGDWTVDGTYTASVQPFDARGVPGERRVATVLLNRREPMAPSNVAGGRSDAHGGVVEVEWAPNRERDILGYRVYRKNATVIKARVCPPPSAGTDAVTTATACTDYEPGNQPTYTVAAVDRPTLGNPSSGTREGDLSHLVISGAGSRPEPPHSLVTTVTNGRVVLAWLPTGNAPAFYRIYRDGVRIDRTVTDLPYYTDPNVADGQPHRYAVSAVSTAFNESELSAEVIAG